MKIHYRQKLAGPSVAECRLSLSLYELVRGDLPPRPPRTYAAESTARTRKLVPRLLPRLNQSDTRSNPSAYIKQVSGVGQQLTEP